MPEIEPEFLLYTGGIEPRKNIDRLLTAYAGLTKNLKEKHQLVIVCRLLPEERARLEETLRELGVAERVHFTGYVSDEQLVSLYGATHCSSFPPSTRVTACRGRGCGLRCRSCRVRHALRSSSSSSTSRRASTRSEVESIRSTMTRCLTEQAMLEHLRRPESYALDSWREVAQRTETSIRISRRGRGFVGLGADRESRTSRRCLPSAAAWRLQLPTAHRAWSALRRRQLRRRISG